MQAVSSQQMVSIDSEMVNIGISSSKMVELAGFFISQVTEQICPKDNRRILILAGSGNNGADAICASRHLSNFDFQIDLICLEPKTEECKSQYAVAKNMGLNFISQPNGEYGLIIDGLIGIGLKENPRLDVTNLINFANNSKTKILSVDIPSGLNSDLGLAYENCINAYCTVTIGLIKKGLLEESAKKYIGRLFLAYLGIPDSIYRNFKIEKPFIASQTLIEI